MSKDSNGMQPPIEASSPTSSHVFADSVPLRVGEDDSNGRTMMDMEAKSSISPSKLANDEEEEAEAEEEQDADAKDDAPLLRTIEPASEDNESSSPRDKTAVEEGTTVTKEDNIQKEEQRNHSVSQILAPAKKPKQDHANEENGVGSLSSSSSDSSDSEHEAVAGRMFKKPVPAGTNNTQHSHSASSGNASPKKAFLEIPTRSAEQRKESEFASVELDPANALLSGDESGASDIETPNLVSIPSPSKPSYAKFRGIFFFLFSYS